MAKIDLFGLGKHSPIPLPQYTTVSYIEIHFVSSGIGWMKMKMFIIHESHVINQQSDYGIKMLGNIFIP